VWLGHRKRCRGRLEADIPVNGRPLKASDCHVTVATHPVPDRALEPGPNCMFDFMTLLMSHDMLDVEYITSNHDVRCQMTMRSQLQHRDEQDKN